MQIENHQASNDIIMSPKKRKYRKLDELAHGGEGCVYNVIVIEDPDGFYNNNQNFVLKEEKLEQQQEQKKRKDDFFKVLYHEEEKNKAQIIRVYEYFEINNTYITIMEKGEQNLTQLIYTKKDLTYLQKFQFCQQITTAINQLHQMNYCHRDLKPDNFILINGQLKLIDFGQVKLIENKQPKKHNQDQAQKAQYGTIAYKPPDDDDDQNIDVWSLGCIFYFIFSGSDFFQSQNKKTKLIENLSTTLQQKIEDNIESQFWQTVIKSTLVLEKNRVSIDKLVENIKINYPIIDIFINKFSTQQSIEIKKIENDQEYQNIQSKLLLQQQFQQKTNDEFCQYVIQTYPIQISNSEQYQMQEKYECNLKEYILNVNQLTEIEKLNICIQISQCINFIHKHKITHKLLKPQDFVKAKSQFKFKNLDFIKIDPQINNPRTSLYVVKNEYSSFEIIYKNASPDQSQDLWSLGIMIFEIMTGKYMFNADFKEKIDKKQINMEKAFEQMESQIRNSLLRFEIKILLKYILVQNSTQRLSTTVIIQFLQNIINQNQIVTLNFGFQKIAASIDNKEYDIFIQEQIVNGLNQYKAQKVELKNFEIIALKFISKKNSESISILKSNQQNFNQCLSFIEINGFFEWKQYHIVQLEYDQQTQNLSQYLYQNQNLSIIDKFKLIIQIINCIKTLHDQEFIHGSLKLENFILSNTQVILADFGNIRKIIQQIDYFLDIYALGQIFYKILVFPNYEANFEFDISFEKDSKLFQQIGNLGIDDEFRKILYKMLNPHKQIKLVDVAGVVSKKIPFSNIRFNKFPFQNQYQQQQNTNFNNQQNQNFNQNPQGFNNQQNFNQNPQGFNNQQNVNQNPQGFNNQQNVNQNPQNLNFNNQQNFNQNPQGFNNQQNQNFNQNQFYKK